MAAAQNYVADGFPTDYPMAAVTENGTDFTFENLATVLRLQLKGDATVASVTVRTLGENEYIAGDAAIDFTSGTPVLAASAEGAASAVTLDCGDGVALSAENETVFNFILIPGEYSGFEVTVTDANGHETVRTTGALELLAGTVKGFEAALDIYSTPQGWNLTGSFNDMNWGNDWIDLKQSDVFFIFKGLEIPEGGEFKIRYGSGEWYGCSSESANKNTAVRLDGGSNISVVAGTYDLYFDQMPHCVFIMDEGETPSFGIVGDFNNWGADGDDVKLTMEDEGIFVAKNVTFVAGAFKIRAYNDSDWAYSIGSASTVEIDSAISVLNDRSSSNITAIAGTYDVYFDLSQMKVWVMTPGQVPAE